MGRFLFGTVFGIVVGLAIAPWVVIGWFRWGHPPVTVTDSALPFEKQIVGVPLHARIDREMKSAPLPPDEQNLVAGAGIYRNHCASCHGLEGQPSPFAAHMYPRAPQLWERHHQGVVGVSDDPPGETYWKVANGIRLSGMPAYRNLLTESQMWQVAVLLANAGKQMPPAAIALLSDAQPGGREGALEPVSSEKRR